MLRTHGLLTQTCSALSCGVTTKCRVHACSALVAPINVAVLVQYKDRCNLELIKPAVDWKKAGARINTRNAAVAR